MLSKTLPKGGRPKAIFPVAAAFSLVELLVVLTIVAAIVALLFGVFGKVLEQRSAISCVQRLRNVGVLIQQGAADNSGFLPWYEDGYGIERTWWYRTYLSSNLPKEEFGRLFVCPALKEPRVVSGGWGFRLGYLYSKNFGFWRSNAWVYPRKSLSLAVFPSRVPMVACAASTPGDNVPGFEWLPDFWSAHGNGTFGNLLFLDGHIERIVKPRPPADMEYKNMVGGYDWDVTQ
jgi:prepilin-type processing-associated H-X9-DG protein